MTETPFAQIVAGRCRDPFAWLGPHQRGDATELTVFLPFAQKVEAVLKNGARVALDSRENGFFVASGLPASLGAADYLLDIDWGGARQTHADPYAFAPLLTDHDIFLFRQGRLLRLAESLGGNVETFDGVEGVLFAVWAPDAHNVSLIGDFNGWNFSRHPMRLRVEAGIWELFVPGVTAGARYKFAVIGADGSALPHKADPLAKIAELPPATASVVSAPLDFAWTDADWLAERAKRQAPDAPISFYEVHVESWLRGQHDCPLSWDGAIDRLIPYVREMGFTHIELMPVMEHPFGGSWGYQPLSLFAPTARLGSPRDFARFIDACHTAGLGVALDWVPGHFPNDAHGLARFDGTALYEHADAREGFHKDWNTLIYNYGRHEVRNFLIASALHWIEAFHIDALRVDAVASMLYRDYSRDAGEWVPNVHGGRENLEAIGFLKEMNAAIRDLGAGAIAIAEESTAFPGVSAPLEQGGLGFQYKWNMGWMNDTLRFFQRDPVHRRFHLNDLTFSLVYAFSEKFVLPLSHDEVVHGKGSLIARMPGDPWRRHAQLRLLYGWMWLHPGKKLLFMGCELAQESEWNHDGALPWPHPDDKLKNGVRRWVADLNALYRDTPALHEGDASPEGFAWIIADDSVNSVLAFRRRAGAREVVAVLNLTPAPRENYRIGAPFSGRWRELLNSDAEIYGGSGWGNLGGGATEAIPAHGEAQSVTLSVPPFGVVVFGAE